MFLGMLAHNQHHKFHDILATLVSIDKTPFINLLTNGPYPIVTCLSIDKTEDNIHFVVFKIL
jgi:hypothetical protein